MSNKSLKMSLSRWHKVVERLVAEATAAQQKAEKIFRSTSVDGYAAQEDKLHGLISEATALVQLHSELTQVICLIKQKTQRVNSSHGVADLLLERDAVQRELTVLRALTQVERMNQVPVEGLKAYFTANADLLAASKNSRAHMFGGNGSGVAVAMLSDSQAQEYDARVKELQKRFNAIGDTISDLNQKTVAIDVSATIAELLGH